MSEQEQRMIESIGLSLFKNCNKVMYPYLFRTWKSPPPSKVCVLAIALSVDDSLNFNAMETRPEEYQSGTFYQESPSYPIIQQEMPPRSRDQRVSAIPGVLSCIRSDR